MTESRIIKTQTNGDSVASVKSRNTSSRSFNKPLMLTHKIPLVSIVVLTYNSSQYVLATLNSAFRQTYADVELIISDDCSQDNTIEVCANWLEAHKERFINTKLVTTEKNTGIPANCNRGVKASKGEWIKLIAGDDLLFDDAIEKLIGCVNDENNLYFGKIKSFVIKDNGVMEILEDEIPTGKIKTFFSLSARQQNDLLKYWNFLPAPGCFIRKSLLDSLNYFDERFPLCEDAPLWFKATLAGYKLNLCDDFVAYYRKDNHSATRNLGKFYNRASRQNQLEVILKVKIPACNLLTKLILYQEVIIEKLRFIVLTKRFRNRKSNNAYLFSALLSGFCFAHWIKKYKAIGLKGCLHGLQRICHLIK
ncbi:MAG TPA: glycosyltransferase [Candidatus Rifleibacterium sp.]|nr:glycosyltransferase [Candidatus Rifleibacterium sp.]